MLHAGNLVPRRAVVLGQLCLDDDLRVEFVRYHKVRRLVEALEALGTPGLAIADAFAAEDVLDGILYDVADQFADGVAMPGEGPTQKTLIEQRRVRHTQIGEIAKDKG